MAPWFIPFNRHKQASGQGLGGARPPCVDQVRSAHGIEVIQIEECDVIMGFEHSMSSVLWLAMVWFQS